MQLLSKVFSVKMVYRQLITIILSIYKNFSLHSLCKALHIQEYSYREISRIKKRSVGAVIKRVNRSLEFMKSAM